MNDRYRTSREGVESSRDHELSVIVGGEVTESGNLNVHMGCWYEIEETAPFKE